MWFEAMVAQSSRYNMHIRVAGAQSNIYIASNVMNSEHFVFK